MRATYRAAAFAAAALSICTAAGFTAPTFASEANGGATVSYIDHVGTTLTADNLGLNDLNDSEQPAHETLSSTPAVTHAIAPALPALPPLGDAPQGRDDRSLSELVADYSSTETPDAESECLARAVYYEAKGEPLSGQLTVAEVILNRAESGRFPATICGVVRQPGQFSFVRRGNIPTPPAGSRDWRVAVAIARVAMQDLADGAAPRALFFHARHVSPGWRRTRVATVGNHVFYR
ncbi:MAG: cell wall hydrolase [Allosphingosinicella sp.]